MKIFRAKTGNLFVVIPDEIVKAMSLSERQELDFKLINSSAAALSVSGKSATTAIEAKVIDKLMSIKFSDRTKENVDKLLTGDEKKCLAELMASGAVYYYNDGKYKGKGVYSITNDYFGKKTEKQVNDSDELRQLKKSKFIAVKNESMARALLHKLESEIKKGEVIAVKTFDGDYFITLSSEVEQLGDKITKAIEAGDNTLKRIAKACNTDEKQCKAIIEILKEQGELIEKKKGSYAVV